MRRLDVPRVQVPVEPRALVLARARSRARFLGVLFGAALAAVAVRGVVLCLEPSERTVREGAVSRWGQVSIRAPRGEILDRNGRRLATSVDTPSVAVDPLLVEPAEVDALAAKVADILDLPTSEVAEKMRRDSRYAKLASRVHPRVAREIEALDHPSLWTHRDPRRYYPEEGLAAQVLGYVDVNGMGRSGLEGALDEHLRGGDLLLHHRRDRRGYDVDPHSVEQPPGDGLDVHTTIDRQIQRITERALAGIALASAPAAAFATVVDVRTGDILAMANYPAYNPNAIGEDAEGRKNRAVQDLFEPGSVYKPFTMAAALAEGVVKPDDTMDAEGGAWGIGRSRIRDDHGHGVITMTETIKYSSNIVSAKLALKMGAPRFITYMRAFGFAERTDVPLPGERRGRLRDPGAIRPIELATTAFGQGTTVTQLQLAMATAAIANHGVRMKPRLVTLVEDVDGVPIWDQPPEVAERVVPADVADTVAQMMVTVTEPGGTGTRARIPGYLVAGKTGTAQKVTDGKYGSARIGSFIGFVPADDPVLAIIVTVDEPTIGSRYGGIVAGPAFAAIGGQSLRYLGVPPKPELLQAKKPEVAVAAPSAPSAPSAPEALRLPWDGTSWTLPDVTGRPVREVLAGLQGAGLELHIEGSGVAVAQRPPAGALVRPGASVAVTFQ